MRGPIVGGSQHWKWVRNWKDEARQVNRFYGSSIAELRRRDWIVIIAQRHAHSFMCMVIGYVVPMSPFLSENVYIVSLSLLTLSIRSSDSSVLSIPYVRTSLGERTFSVIAPRLWNSLSPDSRNSLSLYIPLKTHNTSFQISFPVFPLNSLPSYPSNCLPGFDSCSSIYF